MKKPVLVVAIMVAVSPLIYLCCLYHFLPPLVATHFGLDGKPDQYGSKWTLVMVIALLSVISAGLYFLLTNLERIDPKRSAGQSKRTMQQIAFAILLLLSGVGIMIANSALHNRLMFEKALIPVMGLFFAWLGNLMHNIKPNYFVGIRTPWALESEDTWRKTHQLAGKLWFAGGLLIAISGVSLPREYAFIFTIAIIIIITGIPVVFSYRYFQAHRNHIKNNS